MPVIATPYQSFGSLTNYTISTNVSGLSKSDAQNLGNHFIKKIVHSPQGDIANLSLDDISPLAKFDRPLLPAPSNGYLDTFKRVLSGTSGEHKMSKADTNNAATQEAGAGAASVKVADEKLEMLKKNAVTLNTHFDPQLHILPSMGSRGSITDIIA